MKNLMSRCLIILFYSSISMAAKADCGNKYLVKHPEAALSCYIAIPETGKIKWVIDMDDRDQRGVDIETYQLNSQTWPKPAMSRHGTEWKHRLVIYRPDTVSTHQALLFVNGSQAANNKNNAPPVKLDFARIALATQSIVADLQDVPEQYLTLDDNVPRSEDSLAAYTWSRYLKNPAESPYWPLQIPMTKSVIKAMDAVQEIVKQEVNFQITHFVVSGISKRGEAVWLSALTDKRVNAIVPIAINTVNIKPMLDMTYESYANHWPPAFHDYVAQHISDQIQTPEFTQLLKEIDPFSYLSCQNCSEYKTRLSIPKYIINAGNDDFFVPDSLNVYFEKLPGENLVRIAPNESHAINTKLIEDSLLAYYESIVYQISLPEIEWGTANTTGILKTVTVSSPPVSAKLWEAENPDARDFRFSQHIIYKSKDLTAPCHKKSCEYSLNITAPAKGFKADFVEFTYLFSNGDHFVMTTPVYVTAAASSTAPSHSISKETKMSDQKSSQYLSQMVDVVALSEKICKRPIKAHLSYATTDNFTGQIVDGYTKGLTHVALMTKEAAEALCKVQNDLLKNHNLGLLIYDSYRPKPAVLHFVRWSTEPVEDNAAGKHELAQKLKHYPRIEKKRMFELGYVSADSQHCYGHTVDLVLIDQHGKELNHGTVFDYMDKHSHIDAKAEDIGAEAVKNREILSQAMQKYGFVPYEKEYWHYSYKDKTIKEAMDFAITPDLSGWNVA